MKKILITAAALALTTSSGFAASKPMTQSQKAGYALGAQMGKSFRDQNIRINNKSFMQGFTDSFAGKKLLMTDEQIRAAFTELRNQTMAEMQKKSKLVSAKNIASQAAFLAKNSKKKGVVTLKSGLQYKVLKEGTGPKPKSTDTVTVDYEGTLLDGTVFDSSYARGQKATFAVNGVIKGWQEALPMMRTGSTWQLFIPANLAYGNQGMPPKISPNSILIFKVHLYSKK